MAFSPCMRYKFTLPVCIYRWKWYFLCHMPIPFSIYIYISQLMMIVRVHNLIWLAREPYVNKTIISHWTILKYSVANITADHICLRSIYICVIVIRYIFEKVDVKTARIFVENNLNYLEHVWNWKMGQTIFTIYKYCTPMSLGNEREERARRRFIIYSEILFYYSIRHRFLWVVE